MARSGVYLTGDDTRRLNRNGRNARMEPWSDAAGTGQGGHGMKVRTQRRRAVVRRAAAAAAVLAGALATACGPRAAGGTDHSIEGEAFTTGRAEYVARQDAEQWLIDVDYSFTNTTELTLFVPVCQQPHPPTLEKLEDGAWVTAYSPAVLLCWEPPMEIAPGSQFTDTLRVHAGLPGSNLYPQLEVSEVSGTYRLVWNVLRSNQAGAAAERLTSSTFTIRQATAARPPGSGGLAGAGVRGD
jgi:hypothetical protein